MIFDDPTQTGSSGVPAPAIFTRIRTAIVKARQIRTNMAIVTPPVVFMGQQEWRELKDLCETFDAKWNGGVEGYDPQNNEAKRATFEGFKIYRVDAETFLVAL